MLARTDHSYRPRSVATPHGKRISITENDIWGIFEPLARYAQLTTKQLVAFGSRYPTKIRARLTDLYHEGGGWLERLSEDVQFTNHLFLDEMYRLGPEAERLLITRGVIPDATWLRKTKIGGHSKVPSRVMRLAHDHMACDLALNIEIGARRAEAKYRSHIEIISHAPTATQKILNPLRIPVPFGVNNAKWIEPDALFAIGSRVYALEADRGTESLETVIRGKILAYRAIVSEGIIDEHMGIDNLTVLVVTTSEQRMENMKALVASIARNGKSPMFAFSVRLEVERDFSQSAPSGSSFEQKWQRVGFPDLVLMGH